MDDPKDLDLSRRNLLIGAATSAVAVAMPPGARAQTADVTAAPAIPPSVMKVSFNVNGQARALDVDTRTTLLDALREHLSLFGSKKAAITASAAPARSLPVDGGSMPASRS